VISIVYPWTSVNAMIAFALETGKSENTDESKQPCAKGRIRSSNPSRRKDADIKFLYRSSTGTGFWITNWRELEYLYSKMVFEFWILKALYINKYIYHFRVLNTNVFQLDYDVFWSKHVAIKFTHNSVDCQSTNCQLQALTKSSSPYTVRCGQQSMPLLTVERTDS
jgi:hypothetical protein